tara:strand:+ start:68 stop:232 length:165 start_codon:yes stop_codon:yes gene_type:complete
MVCKKRVYALKLKKIQKRMYSETPVEQILTMDTSHSPFFSAADALVEHLVELAG